MVFSQSFFRNFSVVTFITNNYVAIFQQFQIVLSRAQGVQQWIKYKEECFRCNKF